MSVRRMRRSARSSEAIRDAITSLSHPTSFVDVSSTGCVLGETASFSLIMGMVPSWRSSEAVSRTWGDENVEAGGDIQAKREPWRSAAHTHAEPRCPALGLSSIARANAQYTNMQLSIVLVAVCCFTCWSASASWRSSSVTSTCAQLRSYFENSASYILMRTACPSAAAAFSLISSFLRLALTVLNIEAWRVCERLIRTAPVPIAPLVTIATSRPSCRSMAICSTMPAMRPSAMLPSTCVATGVPILTMMRRAKRRLLRTDAGMSAAEDGSAAAIWKSIVCMTGRYCKLRRPQDT